MTGCRGRASPARRRPRPGDANNGRSGTTPTVFSGASGSVRRVTAWRLALIATGFAVRLACAEGGTVDGGSAALFPYAGFFESDKPIVCMLPPGTRVEKMGAAPLVDGAGAVIAPNYFIQVTVLEGDCKDRVGWITRSHYRGG